MAEDYALDRGKTEPQRNLGYHIHPSIAPRLHKFSRIVDIGTGTGIFLIELSKKLPTTCQLEGFDISDALYPPPATLPANVSLALHDARHAFPAAMKQKYDVVHMRLMVSGLDKDDWEVVAANAKQLLKPGGAIQWAEPDFLHSAYLRSDPGTIPRTLEHVGRRFHNGMDHRLRYGYSTLPNVFERLGFSNVFQDIVASDRISETRKAFTSASYEGIFGWAHKLHANGAPGAWTLQEIEQLKKSSEEEIRVGCYCRVEMHVTIGFASTKSQIVKARL